MEEIQKCPKHCTKSKPTSQHYWVTRNLCSKKISWLVVSHNAINPREASKTSPFAKQLVPPVLFFGSRSVQSNLPSIQSLDCYAGYTTGSRPHVLDELDVSSEVSCHMSWQALSIFSSRLQLMGPGTCIATNAASCWVLQLPPSSRIHHWRDPHLFAASMPCALWAISTTDWFLAWKNRSKEQIAAFSGKVSSCQLPADLHSSGFYPDLHFIRIWEENHKNFPPCFHGET